jgi:hypothetical protein
MTTNENKYLKNAFSTKLFQNNIVYITEENPGWYIKFPDSIGYRPPQLQRIKTLLKIKLPTIIEFEEGKINYRSEMEKLHRLKNLVIDMLLDYETYDKWPLFRESELTKSVLSN